MKILYKKTEENLGAGPFLIAWRPIGNVLAVAGSNNAVFLFDRSGQIVDVLDLLTKVTGLGWDREGDVLAITCDNSSILILWDYNTRGVDQMDTSMGSKEVPVVLQWSPYSPLLVLGTTNGNLFIYNHRTARKTPIVSKHQRRIRCIAITKKQEIVCLADDNTISGQCGHEAKACGSAQCRALPRLKRRCKDLSFSVSTAEGDTIKTYPIGNEGNLLRVGEIKKSSGTTDVMVSCTTGKRIMVIASIEDFEKASNLQFNESYGNIVAYDWFGEGLLFVGFDKGQVVAISAHASELGQEIFSFTDFRGYLSTVTINQPMGHLISLGDNQLKIREMSGKQEVFEIMEIDADKDLSYVSVSADGQMVAVTAISGQLSVFLTKMPILGAAYHDTTAVLSSLEYVTVWPEGEKNKSKNVRVAVEPTLLAVGSKHIAVATNNQVWFYDYSTPAAEGELVAERQYLSTILQLFLSDFHAAIVMDGKVKLHKILETDDDQSITFPDSSRNAKLISVALTPHFLIYSTDTQYIIYFSLDEWSVVSEYRHTSVPRFISPDTNGLRCCVFDDRLDTWVYSAVEDTMFKLPPVGSAIHYKGALWESFTIDRDTFVVYDNSNIYVFLLSTSQIGGESVVFIGSMKIPYGHAPLLLRKGIVHCLTQTGKMGSFLLETHKTDTILDGKRAEEVKELLNRALTLKRWTYVWRLCEQTDNLAHWYTFSQAALQDSNIELALKIFCRIGDVSMVFALQQLVPIEEKTLLAGQVAVLLNKFDQAEVLLLQSSNPKEALNLRRDLLDWPRALQLAETLAPQEIPQIAKEYAQQLEFSADYSNALVHYETGVIEESDELVVQEHNEICRSGIARMAIRTGDIRRGVQMAKSLEGRIVKRDCAIALEQLKQYSEAAELYEVGQYYDRAAAVCLKAKAWGKVAELLPKVRSPKVHAQFGRIMEAEKKYKQAAVAYKNGRDYDNLVRMLLDHLDMAEDAVKVVRESRSIEGAKLVAKFFSKLGDHSSAIKFLILSQCHQEAFQLAETHEMMTEYADAIEENGSTEQFVQLAEHFVASGDPVNAGRFFYRANQCNAALDYLTSVGENHEAIIIAIECVSRANDKQLIDRLRQFLMGETDGLPKDAQYLFRMFVALKMTTQAAKTAIVIAREQQDKGQYKVARDVLFAMYQELTAKKIRIPQEMDFSLMIIHSYMIVRSLLSRKESLRAARMLIRVINNINRFPSHCVHILTSCVVVCSKAGLRATAQQYAIQLMAPEYRNRIDAKYKKKIELMVRKAEKVLDAEEARSPCPYCDAPLLDTDLSCDKCKMSIPYCVITGRHIIKSDFALCAFCNFPGYFSEFKRLASTGEGCSMCGSPVNDVIPSDCAEFLNNRETVAD